MVKTRKAYPVHKVKKGNGPAGQYTIVKISDSKRNPDNTWTREYYSVLVNADVDVYVNGKISFTIIDGVRAYSHDYNGKTYYDCTIYVNRENFVIEEIGGEEPTFETQSHEDMPF